jgi:hypothetical protein
MISISSAAKWHRAHWARVACLILCFSVACSAVASAAAPKKDQTKARIATALQGLQRYYSSHSLEDLHGAVDALTSAVDMNAIKHRNRLVRRRTVVQAWAQVLREVELSYDPTFDPNDRPATCLVPPREASGRQLPSCADPSDIQDPAARAVYVAALQANDHKIQQANHYQELRNIDDDAMLSLRLNLAGFHTVTPADSAALDGILRRAGLSESRRTKIDAMF